MEISFLHQIALPFLSFGFGIIAGALYDIVRIIRCCLGISYTDSAPKWLSNIKLPLLPHEGIKGKTSPIREVIIIGVTDILYFIVLTVFMCIFAYAVNKGKMRWFIYFFALLGFFTYYITVGRLIIRVSSVASFVLRAFFLYIFLFLFVPVRVIFRLARYTYSKIYTSRKNVKKRHISSRTVLIRSGKRE